MGNVLQAYCRHMRRWWIDLFMFVFGEVVFAAVNKHLYPDSLSSIAWKLFGRKSHTSSMNSCNSEAVWVLPFLIMSLEIPTWHNAVSYAAPRAGNPTSDGRHAIWPGALKPEVDASARPALASWVRKHRSVLQQVFFVSFLAVPWIARVHSLTVSTNYLDNSSTCSSHHRILANSVGPMDQFDSILQI